MHEFNCSETTTEVLGSVPIPQPSAEKQLCFVVVTGADKGLVFTLKSGTYTLGRSAQHADFVVNGRGLSRAHAKVVVSETDGVEIHDLNSTNGVFVNGVRVTIQRLQPGDTLTLGPEVSFRLDAPDQTIQSLLKEMQRSATVDALTGILNRGSFLERLSEELSLTKRHDIQSGLALLDVDHFKKINDTYGHPAGDAVLIEVAKRLSSCVRAEDVVARFGGEEFVILIRHTPPEGCRYLLERVRQSIADEPFEILTPDGQNKKINATISIGLAHLDVEKSKDQNIEVADQALYRAKHNGRNRVES